eukprot:13541960-Alexandrium_andersonii.AAC.1
MAHRMNAQGRDGPEREGAGRSGWWAEEKPVFLFGGGARSGSRANAHVCETCICKESKMTDTRTRTDTKTHTNIQTLGVHPWKPSMSL